MQKKFLFNLVLLLALNFLIKPVWIFGIDRTVQNILGASEYGLYYALLNFSFLFSILLDLGITNYSSKTISASRNLVIKYFPQLLLLKWLLVIVYVIITLFFALLTGFDNQVFTILFVLMLNQVLVSFILFIRANISALHHFTADGFLSVLDKTLMILGGAMLIFFQKVTVTSFVLIQTGALILTCATAFGVLKAKARQLWKPKANRSTIRVLFKQTFPYALLVFLMTVYSKVDTVMLERMLPDGDFHAGIYAQGYRIVESLSMTGYLFSVLLLPVFAYQIKNRLNFASVIQTALKMLYPFAVFTVIFIWFYTVPIANWLYTDVHPQTFESMGIVNLIFLPVSMGYIFGTLLTANGSLKFLNRVSFAGLMVNLLLNYWLIPVMQTKGAALASVITQSLVVVIQIIYCIKIFRFSLNIKKVVSFIAFPVICYLMLDFLDRNTGWFWGYNFFLFAGLNLIVLRLMNLLPVKDFLQLLNWRK